MNRLKKEQRQHTHTHKLDSIYLKFGTPIVFQGNGCVHSPTRPAIPKLPLVFSLVQPLTGWDPGVKGMKTQAHTDLSLGETLKSGVCFTPIFWWVGKGWKQVMKPILAT